MNYGVGPMLRADLLTLAALVGTQGTPNQAESLRTSNVVCLAHAL